MANITSLLKYSLKTNIVKSILFEIISNTSRYFYTFGRCLPWPEVIGPRSANIFTVERTNNVVRITTRTPHGLFVNDKIIVSANALTQINNPPATSPKTIVQAERSAGVVTITTQTPHGFVVGSTVEINSDIDAIDGIFTVTERIGGTNSVAFKYAHPGNNINLTTDIDGTASLYTAFTVTDVINDLTFTYNKTGPNIPSVAEVGEVYSVERDVISNENDPPSVSDNYPYELEVRNEMLVMKLIDSNDVSIVVPRTNWQPGITYDMFDEYSGDRLSYTGATSLAQAKFYVLTDEFNVYKCIFNNNDKPSSIKPTSTSPTSEELTLADGYVWKFMYTIPIALRNKFLTSEYMPVLSALTNQFYSSGSITNYSIVSSGNGYIANTYKIKSFDITNNGSGYTNVSSAAGNNFTILSIQRTGGELTITVDTNHNVSSANTPGGAIRIFPSVSSVTVGGNVVPLDIITTQNPNGIHVIKEVNSANSFTIENAGADIPLTNISGLVRLTGAFIEFPSVSGGTQAKAYISEYGSGGTIEKIVVVNQGSGYLAPPIATITMTNGLTPTLPVEYNINYDFKDTTNGYTEVVVEGDGYNLKNPYSLKQVIINNNQRGVFNSVITGEIFDFPEPDLEEGRKPSVSVAFRPITKSYNIIESGRIDLNGGTAVITVSGTSTTSATISNVVRGSNIVTVTTLADHTFLTGQTVIVSANTNTGINGTFTITGVPSSNTFTYSQTGTDIASASDSGTITVLSYSIGDQITVSGSTVGGGVFNGTHTITNIVGLNIFFLLVGPEILGVTDTGSVVNVAGELGYEVDTVTVTDEGYGYSKPFIFGDTASDNYFSVFANDLTTNGFNCSLDENNQKNSAVLLPLLNSFGQIETLQIVEPGVGYTYAFINVKGYKKVGGSLVQMTPQNTAGFRDANIQLRFSVGDIDSRQSTVELLAKEGSISCIKVENGGQNYASGTRIVVLGDGSGCQAVPEIADGKIVKVTILNPGTGYTKADAYISGPMTGNNPLSITPVTNGTGALVRAILSPKGGHGRDAISELYGRSIYFTSRLSNEKNKGIVTQISGISSSNDYRQVTILKNPSKYEANEYYAGSFGSACILVGVNVTSNNTIAFNNIFQDDVLELSTDPSKKFVVVEKQLTRLGKDLTNKYYLVLQTVDNYIPEINSVLSKVTSTSTYSIIISSLQLPEFNKFTGDMLYINNRTAFTPSEQQTVVVSTLINF